MWKKHVSTAAAVSVAVLAFLFCGNKSYFSGGDWVAKINDDKITINMLNAYYYAQQKQIYSATTNEEIDKMANDPDAVDKNPTLNKEEFLENYIRQRLVYNKAIEEGMMNDQEVQAHIEMATEAVVVAQYVKNKYKTEIKISPEEIAEAYAKNRDRFKGVPIEQAEQYIQQNIFQQELQKKLRELVESLKESSIISKNLAPLKASESKNEKKGAEEEAKSGEVPGIIKTGDPQKTDEVKKAEEPKK